MVELLRIKAVATSLIMAILTNYHNLHLFDLHFIGTEQAHPIIQTNKKKEKTKQYTTKGKYKTKQNKTKNKKKKKKKKKQRAIIKSPNLLIFSS